mgnify:CR=1 FL=1
MSLLTEAVAQEQRRIERMIEEYQSELEKLPKGALTTKTVKGNSYYYLQYRDGKKSVSKYVGKDSGRLQELQLKLDRRRHVLVMLKALKQEYALSQKMMEAGI